DRDAIRIARQRLLARGIEQAFRLQPALELLEREQALPETRGAHGLDHELVAAARLVHRDAAEGLDREPVAQLEAQPRRLAQENRAFDQRAIVLEREVAAA